MNNNRKAVSQNSTIYTYRLLQRVHYQPYYFYIYTAIGIGAAAYSLLHLSPLQFMGGMIGVPLVHFFFLLLMLHTKEKRAAKTWRWYAGWPWIGYAPSGYLSLSRLRRLHRQLFWVLLLLAGCLYPWLPLPLLAFLGGYHLYLLFPRLFLLWRFRQHKEHGYVIINEKDTSCYAQ